jgi:hypothetical protein
LPFTEGGILGRPSFAVNCKEQSETGNPQRCAGSRFCIASLGLRHGFASIGSGVLLIR